MVGGGEGAGGNSGTSLSHPVRFERIEDDQNDFILPLEFTLA